MVDLVCTGQEYQSLLPGPWLLLSELHKPVCILTEIGCAEGTFHVTDGEVRNSSRPNNVASLLVFLVLNQEQILKSGG